MCPISEWLRVLPTAHRYLFWGWFFSSLESAIFRVCQCSFYSEVSRSRSSLNLPCSSHRRDVTPLPIPLPTFLSLADFYSPLKSQLKDHLHMDSCLDICCRPCPLCGQPKSTSFPLLSDKTMFLSLKTHINLEFYSQKCNYFFCRSLYLPPDKKHH